VLTAVLINARAGLLRVAWELSALHAVGFGGIVSLAVHLPTCPKTVFRPIGGRLADHVHPAGVTAWAPRAVALLAGVLTCGPSLTPTAAICTLVTAAGLGAAGGSVFVPAARGAQPRLSLGRRHRGIPGGPARVASSDQKCAAAQAASSDLAALSRLAEGVVAPLVTSA